MAIRDPSPTFESRRQPNRADLSGDVTNVFSIDVEDYFHDEAFRHLVPQDEWETLEQRVDGSTRRLLEMLDEYQVAGTFYVLGWVAERHPQLVADIHQAGHEIGIHGYDHRPISALEPHEFREDIHKSIDIVTAITGEPVLGYRAPTFSVVEDTMWAIDILIEEGIVYDASVFPIVHDRYGIPDAERHPHTIDRAEGSLIEFPMSTVRFAGRNLPFVGGGYQRLLPMGWVRRGMRRVVEGEKRPVMLYVHPWEVDPDHPILEMAFLARQRHYYGLSRVEGRLRELLSTYRFAPARRVLGL